MNRTVRKIGAMACIVLLSGTIWAVGPQKNGNELALEYSTATESQKKEIQTNATGGLFFFRYLRITNMEKGETNGWRYIKMSTIEPSSDMYVDFTVTKKVSLERADVLKEGDGIAVSGRIKSIGEQPNKIILDPVIVRHKDRLSPKAGMELLYEVDPNARKGTDTSTGEEKVIK